MQLCSKPRGARGIEPETFRRRGQLLSRPPTTGPKILWCVLMMNSRAAAPAALPPPSTRWHVSSRIVQKSLCTSGVHHTGVHIHMMRVLPHASDSRTVCIQCAGNRALKNRCSRIAPPTASHMNHLAGMPPKCCLCSLPQHPARCTAAVPHEHGRACARARHGH